MLNQLFNSCRTGSSSSEVEKFVALLQKKKHVSTTIGTTRYHNEPAGEILIPSSTVVISGSHQSTKQFLVLLVLILSSNDSIISGETGLTIQSRYANCKV